ncbi:MAG: hypothetical protein WCL61_01770 [bacterium]
MEGENNLDSKFVEDSNEQNSVDQRVKRGFLAHKPKGEKLATITLMLVGVVAIFYGFFSSYYNISKPTWSRVTPMVQKEITSEQLKNQLAVNVEQQGKDTDMDGLNDYDEINVYKTSPYLKDSNGDGIDDKKSIALGVDPNCLGENCKGVVVSGADVAQSVSVPTLQDAPTNSLGFSPEQITSGQATPSMLRQLLQQGGASVEVLAQISDTDLMTTYQNMIEANKQMQNSSSTSSVNVSSSTSFNGSSVDLSAIKSIDDLAKLTGPQIRQLMLSQGADANMLSQISDADIKTIFTQQLEKNKANYQQ